MSLSGAPGVHARPSPVWTGETPVAPSCGRSRYSLYKKPATSAARKTRQAASLRERCEIPCKPKRLPVEKSQYSSAANHSSKHKP
jgi:hypothetical protein